MSNNYYINFDESNIYFFDFNSPFNKANLSHNASTYQIISSKLENWNDSNSNIKL